MINNLRKENQELVNELNRARNESTKTGKRGKRKGNDSNLKAEITKLKN